MTCKYCGGLIVAQANIIQYAGRVCNCSIWEDGIVATAIKAPLTQDDRAWAELVEENRLLKERIKDLNAYAEELERRIRSLEDELEGY